MNLSEKIINKLVGILMLIFGLTIIALDIKSGYKSFVIYIIPLIFVASSLFIIYRDSISNLFTKIYESNIMIKPKKWIEMNLVFGFFILPFSIFLLIGLVLLYFAIKYPTNVGIVGWITIILFVIVPIISIYRLIYGFSISEKRQKQIENSLDSLSANDEGISIELTVSDKTFFVSWDSIDAIIYYNFYVSSDFTEYYEGYKFYLNKIPIYTKYEKQWWLNKLFPKNSQSKIIEITVNTRHFQEIPKMIERNLNTKADIDFKNPLKGTLISSETYQSKNKMTTIEKWKPTNNDREKIVFNKLNQTIEEINKNYR